MSLVDVANGIEMHGVVKSVQRGESNTSIGRDEGLTITINEVDTSKSILILHSFSLTGQKGTLSADYYSCNGKLINANQIYLYYTYNSSYGNSLIKVNWQVIEFY